MLNFCWLTTNVTTGVARSVDPRFASYKDHHYDELLIARVVTIRTREIAASIVTELANQPSFFNLAQCKPRLCVTCTLKYTCLPIVDTVERIQTGKIASKPSPCVALKKLQLSAGAQKKRACANKNTYTVINVVHLGHNRFTTWLSKHSQQR